MKKFRANGKLLLTGEYFVLDGAKALALPTIPGQQMTFVEGLHPVDTFTWKSYSVDGTIWFEGVFSKKEYHIISCDDQATAQRLQEILVAVTGLNPGFNTQIEQLTQVSTALEFPRTWGLGTSSTLIAMIAKWAEINPYALLEKTFGGSGYDLACASAIGPLLYELPGPVIKPVHFAPSFSDQLYFVYLNKKQNSREGIRQYRSLPQKPTKEIREITELTQAMLDCNTLNDFKKIIIQHEAIVAKTLKLQKAKELYFKDYPGAIKSLGAWGGDFILATGDESEDWVQHYFNQKKMSVFKPYRSIIKNDGLEMV